jgi:light-regulated signal transduction histidine kinase (bacteriophytochrome)
MVASYTQLLERRYKDKLDQDANDFIQYAVDGANRMQKLINDLLDYSRTTSRGKDFAKVDSSQVLGQTISNLQQLIIENNALITTEDLPELKADESQIMRVFQNLIVNAIKFKKKSEMPKIHISCEKKNEFYEFAVRDNGIGIEMQYQDKVFAIFQRLHSTKDYPGTGIGLSICKRVVERHGGKIWFESKENEGTTFYFTIKK